MNVHLPQVSRAAVITSQSETKVDTQNYFAADFQKKTVFEKLR
jgi:hypothetical protein